MNAYDFYLSPEDYDTAAGNGIKAHTLEVRIRQLGWSKDKALNTPPRVVSDWSAWHAVAEKHSISKHLFRHRVNSCGWTPERAASQPMTTTADRKRLIKQAKAVQVKFDSDLLQQAEQNGIQANTFYARVRRGWDPERAASEPLWTASENGTASVRKIRERCGDFKQIVINGNST